MLVFVLLSKITWFLKFFGYFYLKDTHTHTHTHTHTYTRLHIWEALVWGLNLGGPQILCLWPHPSLHQELYMVQPCHPLLRGAIRQGLFGVWALDLLPCSLSVPPCPPPRATRSSSWCWHDDCAGRPRAVTARLKTWVTNWLTSKNFSPPWLQKLAQILSLFPFSTAFPSSRTPPPWTKAAFWSKLWWAPYPVNRLHALCLVNGTGPQWSREGLADAKGPFQALSPCMPSSPRFIFLFKKLHFVYLFLAVYFVLGYSQWTMW